MRARRLPRILDLVPLTLLLAVAVGACATSTPGQPVDAEVVVADASTRDAAPVDAVPADAAPPDAVPCVPDPDGETCNGNDDDCDGTTDEGYAGVGEACEVTSPTGTWTCVVKRISK